MVWVPSSSRITRNRIFPETGCLSDDLALDEMKVSFYIDCTRYGPFFPIQPWDIIRTPKFYSTTLRGRKLQKKLPTRQSFLITPLASHIRFCKSLAINNINITSWTSLTEWWIGKREWVLARERQCNIRETPFHNLILLFSFTQWYLSNSTQRSDCLYFNSELLAKSGEEHQNSEIHWPVKMMAGVSLKESMADLVLSPWMDMVTKILSPESSFVRVSIVVVETRVSSNPEMMASLPLCLGAWSLTKWCEDQTEAQIQNVSQFG